MINFGQVTAGMHRSQSNRFHCSTTLFGKQREWKIRDIEGTGH